MKKFGLIGGTSWYSTVEYYQLINSACNKHFGNNTNPPIYLANINQNLIHSCQKKNDWETIIQIYLEKSKELEKLGVEALAFCANTPHKIYHEIQCQLSIPIIHIADSIADKLNEEGLSQVGLLGTAITMQGDFIKSKLVERGIKTIVPDIEAQSKIQNFLYDEMSTGTYSQSCCEFFEDQIEVLVEQGAEAAILACTEFPILLKSTQIKTPLVNSLEYHCDSILKFILGN